MNKIINKNGIKHSVQSETQFIPASICYGICLNNNIKVYSRLGTKKICVRIADNFDQILENRSHFNRKIIESLSLEKDKDNYIKKGLEIVQNRFNDFSSSNGPTNEIDSELIKVNLINKQNYIDDFDKSSICKLYGWTETKPIGVILANDLTDGLFISKKNTFKDNYTWLFETIKRAKKNKNFNWLIKPHPREIKNKVKMTTRHLVRKIDESNIRLLPENYSSKSLPNFVDIVFTDHGSAGYEYPAIGIPSVTTSTTIYDKLNISVSIDTRKITLI